MVDEEEGSVLGRGAHRGGRNPISGSLSQISQLDANPQIPPAQQSGAVLTTEEWPLHPSLAFRAGPGAPPQRQSSATKRGSGSGTAVGSGRHTTAMTLTEHLL